MTVRLTAVRNGREGRNSQKIAGKRENSESQRRHVGENEVLGVGQEKREINEE